MVIIILLLLFRYARADCSRRRQYTNPIQPETNDAYFLPPRLRRHIAGGGGGSGAPSFPLNYYTEKPVVRHSKKDLFFGVLLPSDEYILDRGSTRGILAGMELAIDRVVADDETGILPGFNITMEYRDTMCSSTHGALAAFDIILKRKPGFIWAHIFIAFGHHRS